MNAVIPSPDPTGLPAPVWLLQGLLVFTFILHLVPMNFVLGGGFVAGWAAWRSRSLTLQGEAKRGRLHGALAARLMKLMPVCTAFSITLGIAPLLFLQVLYGQLFYTSSVLMAWIWLAIIGLLMAGYYGFYGAALAEDVLTRKSAALSFGSSLTFLIVGGIFTHNLSLMERPEVWEGMYRRSEYGLHSSFGDPTVWPRFLHYGVAALALTGVLLAILGSFERRSKPEVGAWMSAAGVRLFIGATLVQLATGIWYLFALPERVRMAFLGGSPVDTAILWGSVVLAAVAMALMRRSAPAGVAATALTMVGMSIARQRVRVLTLEPYFTTSSLEVNPQTVLFLIFAVLLVAGLGVVGWMVWKFAAAGKTPGLAEATGEGKVRSVA